MSSIKGIAAVFLVADVGATARWYRDHLGFQFWTHPDAEPFEWASVRRDGAEIMLQRGRGYSLEDRDPYRPGAVWDLYLYVDDVDALFASVEGKVTIGRAPCDQVYDMREFDVIDPDGRLLVFGQDIGAR